MECNNESAVSNRKWYEYATEIADDIGGDNIAEAIRKTVSVASSLCDLPIYLDGLQREFANTPRDIASAIHEFVRCETLTGRCVKSVYCEMSPIPSSFYHDNLNFCLFGYADTIDSSFGSLDDWMSEGAEAIRLHGMENIVDCFDEDGRLIDFFAQGYLHLVIGLRFQDLIRRSVEIAELPSIDFLASVHDFPDIPLVWRK